MSLSGPRAYKPQWHTTESRVAVNHSAGTEISRRTFIASPSRSSCVLRMEYTLAHEQPGLVSYQAQARVPSFSLGFVFLFLLSFSFAPCLSTFFPSLIQNPGTPNRTFIVGPSRPPLQVLLLPFRFWSSAGQPERRCGWPHTVLRHRQQIRPVVSNGTKNTPTAAGQSIN